MNEMMGRHLLGLLGIGERAKLLGGTFEIFGVPDDGTLVMVSFPVSQFHACRVEKLNDQNFISR